MEEKRESLTQRRRRHTVAFNFSGNDSISGLMEPTKTGELKKVECDQLEECAAIRAEEIGRVRKKENS